MDDLKKKIKISDCFIIAEIGMNHDGSLGNAIKLIKEAKNSGVNAVKFQLHISEEETLLSAPKPPYFKLEDRYEYFKRTSFSLNEWKKLKELAHKENLYFIVSPFSHKAVNLLEEIEIDGYKIASGETTNLPLLEYIDAKNKPVLLSTGMSNWEEISNATEALKNNLIVIFQCSSQYPCRPEDVGLNVIKEMHKCYPRITIGFSDHTIDNYSSIAALVLGAKVFEKHFTLSKKMYGADAKFSLEPNEMKEYVNGIKFVFSTLKNPVNKDDIDKYNEMKVIFEKSIVSARDLNEGHIIKFEDLDFKKPGDGIRADRFREIIGKQLLKDLSKNEKINFDNFRHNSF